MELEIVMLSGGSQAQKGKCCKLSLNSHFLNLYMYNSYRQHNPIVDMAY